MKKTILPLILLPLIFALAACNGTSAEPVAASAAENQNMVAAANENNSGNNADAAERQFSLSSEMMLMLGTVKLDETDYAVDAEQASQLLPLWKALRSFSESETAAQAEVDAVIAQIEDTMMPEQIRAIEAMQLTMQDAAAVAEALGLEVGGFGGRMGDITPEMQATMEAARQSGQRPGGGLGPGGGQGPGGGEIDPAARETAMAERGGVRGAGAGLNTVYLEALIEFLEAKIQ